VTGYVVEIDPKNKAMIDAIVDVRERERSHRAWHFGSSLAWEVSERSTQFGLNSTVRSTGSIRCARGHWAPAFPGFSLYQVFVAISMQVLRGGHGSQPNNAPTRSLRSSVLVASSISSARWARTLGAMDPCLE